MRDLVRLIKFLLVVMAAMAVVQELQKPQPQRTWNGRVLGLVPYNLRMPSLDRIVSASWCPADAHLFRLTPWGGGWVVNIALEPVFINRREGERCE